MNNMKADQLNRITFPLVPSLIPKYHIKENTQGLLHSIRTWSVGECPSCHCTHNKQIKGWNKLECENCGHIWNY